MSTHQSDAQLGRRERHKADKRARILAASTELFTRQGYEATTIAQVADQADVAVGTVFQYAATKPELLLMSALPLWSQAVSLGQARARGIDQPHERICALLTPIAQISEQHGELGALVAQQAMFGLDGEHQRALLRQVTELEQAVSDVLTAHGCTAQRALVAARVTISGALIELYRTRTKSTPQPIAVRLKDVVEVVLAGALPAGG